MNLREMRKEAGLTQKELASRLGMSVEYIRQVEKGQRRPGQATRWRIREALHARGFSYSPPEIPFDNAKQAADLKAMWLERGYGTE